MIAYPFKDRTKKVLKPNTSARQRDAAGQPKNIVGAVGMYSTTLSLYATGKPGDEVELLLMFRNTALTPDNPKRDSDGLTQRFTIGDEGVLRESVEFKHPVARGIAVYSKVRTPATNTGDVTITLQDSNAYMFKG